MSEILPTPSYSLPSLNADPALVTVAGFSSGGYNAHFLQIAMSDSIKGAGLFNGMVYSRSFNDRIHVKDPSISENVKT
jgi:acetyl esterase/lipase